MIDEKLLKTAESTLKNHARALGIAPGAYELFVKRSLNAAKKSLKNHSHVTETDLNRALVRELKKYNSDLAYVCENYDKII